jgi:hypothetical protein
MRGCREHRTHVESASLLDLVARRTFKPGKFNSLKDFKALQQGEPLNGLGSIDALPRWGLKSSDHSRVAKRGEGSKGARNQGVFLLRSTF